LNTTTHFSPLPSACDWNKIVWDICSQSGYACKWTDAYYTCKDTTPIKEQQNWDDTWLLDFHFYYKLHNETNDSEVNYPYNINIVDDKIFDIAMVWWFYGSSSQYIRENWEYCWQVWTDKEFCVNISGLTDVAWFGDKYLYYTASSDLDWVSRYRWNQVFELYKFRDYVWSKWWEMKLKIKDLWFFRDIRWTNAKFWLKLKKPDWTVLKSREITFTSSKLDWFCQVNWIDNWKYSPNSSIYTSCSSASDPGSTWKWYVIDNVKWTSMFSPMPSACDANQIKLIDWAKEWWPCNSSVSTRTNCIHNNTYYDCKNQTFWSPMVSISTNDYSNFADNDISENWRWVATIVAFWYSNLRVDLKSAYFTENNTYLCNHTCTPLVNWQNWWSYEKWIGWHFKWSIWESEFKYTVEAKNAKWEAMFRTKYIDIVPMKHKWVFHYSWQKSAWTSYDDSAKEWEQCVPSNVVWFQNWNVLDCLAEEFQSQVCNKVWACNPFQNYSDVQQKWFYNKQNELR
jgi:hypothetical protein